MEPETWRIARHILDGRVYYAVYRLRHGKRLDIPKHRQSAGRRLKSRDLAQRIAFYLNVKEGHCGN